MGTRSHSFKAHLPDEALNTLSIHLNSRRHSDRQPSAVKGRSSISLINVSHELQGVCDFLNRVVVRIGSSKVQSLTWPSNFQPQIS